ncbi:ankyrin repeat domain-containing protein [Arenibacter sp. 6A1]|uniref:ankyrin repeat domain-containing protein n=1 Tax=Arenibacter sp. 6A1 TaxID=2720391 RepID=UPI001444A2EF|nr:ankyrin repeat domain-containing protein [Arenibacter sp. 6A1]NKI27412.1 ankyrin repeat domain-containing protein [Arenibacter sp. 6A1]
MRKTIIITTGVLLLMVHGLSAKNLLYKGVNYDSGTTIKIEEISPFCKAIVKGDIESVKRYLENGVDVNQKSLGKTPVIFAARYNRGAILELLIKNGADVTLRCNSGYSALKYAEEANALETLKIIENQLKK